MPSHTNSTGTKRRRGSEPIVTRISGSVHKDGVASINASQNQDAQVSDREAFLNAFEKPTQIYRYLRACTMYNKPFIERTLGYMKHRMSRNHSKRKDFKVDNMLTKAMENEKTKIVHGGKAIDKNFLNIYFIAFQDGQNWLNDTKATVEIEIWRVCLKKRKETTNVIVKSYSGSAEVKVYSPVTSMSPTCYAPPTGKCSVLSVPSDCFNLVNGHVVQFYVLVMKVTVPKGHLTNSNRSARMSARTSSENGDNSPVALSVSSMSSPPSKSNSVHTRSAQLNTRNSASRMEMNSNSNNNNNSNHLTDDEEPKTKRRRSAPTRDRENFIYGSGAHAYSVAATSNHTSPKHSPPADDEIIFIGEVKIYDKDKDGKGHSDNCDYEVVLKEKTFKKAASRLKLDGQTWECLPPDNPNVQAFENNSKRPNNSYSKMIAMEGKGKLFISIRSSATSVNGATDPPPRLVAGSEIFKEDCFKTVKDERRERVIYQFLYNSNDRQQTEAREDFQCPWCSLNCGILYSLLKHLKLCHARLLFSYVPQPSCTRIDVSINDNFDGSYSGSAYDLVAQPPGEAFARNGPTKRTEIFCMLVCHPPKLKPSLQEFLEGDEKEMESRRSYITGHNRLYHHTTTCLPINPKEIDVDSEGEPDPEWLRAKTTMMIDEFTDVNEGEKELMKMWNLHMLKYNYVGDCQIVLAVDRFIDSQGEELIRKNLYRNFVVHLTNLVDFELLTSVGMFNAVIKLQKQMKDNNTGYELRNHWEVTQGTRAALNFAGVSSQSNSCPATISEPSSQEYTASNETTTATSFSSVNGHFSNNKADENKSK